MTMLLHSDNNMAQDHVMPRNIRLAYRLLISSVIFLLAWNQPFARGAPPDSAEGLKRVLVLHSYNFNQHAQQRIADGLESARKTANINSGDFLHEYLDITPLKSPEQRFILRQLLLKKYADQRFDLIITVFDDALNFLMDEGKELSPESPCLALYGSERPNLERAGKRVVQSPLYLDVRGTLELSLRLFPRTNRVLFVSGKGARDLIIEDKARAEFASWQGEMEFEYASNRSVGEILEQAAHLPSGTIVIFAGVSSDITGRNFIPKDVAVMLARASNVPVFCLATSQLDTGVVGGSMVDLEALGAMLGRVLPSIVLDEPVSVEPASYFIKTMVNWQQVERWGVEARLPDESVIINRPATLWNQHKGSVIAAILVLIVLLLFIVILRIQNSRLAFAEARARESEDRYRVLIEHAPDAIVVYDSDLNRFVEVNARAEKLFGCGRDELRESDIFRFYHTERSDKQDVTDTVVEHVSRALSGEALQFERTVFGADGRETLCEVHTVRLPSKKGGLIRASYIDITERKRAEDERERLQGQLVQAQKMESVGRLAGGVAHDYNNMLGVILGHTELAMGKVKTTHPLYTDLMVIRKATERSADLTRQLLAFARKQTVSLKVVDMNRAVEGMLKMLRRLIGEDIALAWLPGKDVWPVQIDPSQIDQLMVNLCVNARDAIAGVGKITIETANATFDAEFCAGRLDFVPGNYVLIAVSDNGCGMDKETMAKIFEPFFTTKRLGQGTGLGLATVYGIVKQNNGFINVYSEPNQGSTFRIYLPYHAGSGEHMEKETAEAVSAGGQETILLVEDEQSVLTMTTMMLKCQGYTVLAAATPGEAINLAEEQVGKIHLLLTDVIMPEMNGRDLAKRLMLIYPGLKCLFMSGYTADVIARHSVLDKNVRFIQKPFSKNDLAAKVREALDDKNE